MISHSKIETYKNCGRQFKFRYIDGLKTLPNYDPDNPLVLGIALHSGIERNEKEALAEYAAFFPQITDQHIEEMMKLSALIDKCRKILPEGGEFEHKIEYGEFVGYIDYLLPVAENTYDIFDFKYSNAINRYRTSGQLSEYKYFLEKAEGKKVRNLYFLLAPKISIRRKKDESTDVFRLRLKKEIERQEDPQLLAVDYDEDKVKEFLSAAREINENPRLEIGSMRLCKWCEYFDFCQKGEKYMLLPKNERKNAEGFRFKKVWIYGLPFSGKTFFANKWKNVLMLNTDGNTKAIDAPVMRIADKVTVEGRMTKRVFAWEIFKEIITELEKKQNDFETIVVDLLEDTYEYCRLWCYDHLGIEHESDNSFKAWDFVRTEFLSTIKRLMNLDYNIILISHEDTSKDVTKRSGDKVTSIKPNITDRIALKIAGMVDIVGRCLNDDGNRTISFKSNEVVFGGGRLNISKLEIPTTLEDFLAIYPEVKKDSEPVKAEKEPEKKPEEGLQITMSEEKLADEAKAEAPAETPAETPVRRRRRVRENQ